MDFQQDDSQGNPVLAYLQRHGTAQGLTTHLINGYSLNTPDVSTTFNAPFTYKLYSKISKDCAFAGHSLGEHSALASIADISALVDVVLPGHYHATCCRT